MYKIKTNPFQPHDSLAISLRGFWPSKSCWIRSTDLQTLDRNESWSLSRLETRQTPCTSTWSWSIQISVQNGLEGQVVGRVWIGTVLEVNRKPLTISILADPMFWWQLPCLRKVWISRAVKWSYYFPSPWIWSGIFEKYFYWIKRQASLSTL